MLFRPSNRHIRQHIALNETGTLGLVRKVSDEDRHIWVKKKKSEDVCVFSSTHLTK